MQAGLPSPLRELTCHMGSHSVTCHPAEVTFLPLPQPKLVLDLATPKGCKAELTKRCVYAYEYTTTVYTYNQAKKHRHVRHMKCCTDNCDDPAKPSLHLLCTYRPAVHVIFQNDPNSRASYSVSISHTLSVIVQSCMVHFCVFVRRCLVLHCPPSFL